MANFLTTFRAGLSAGFKGKSLSAVDANRGWYRIFEPSAGAWQRNQSIDVAQVNAHHAVFACTTLLASDMAKLRLRVVRDDGNDIWRPVRHKVYTPLFRRPNHFQNRFQFVEYWALSKLQRGNTYCLKQRNGRGDITGLYVLDPTRVVPMLADNGDVFYGLQTDKLPGIDQSVIVPAREIIHDRWNCLHHPLIGLPPIYASGMAAAHGIAIQTSQSDMFQNNVQPGGLLIAPGRIDADNAKRLKTDFEENFGGRNAGRIAVLGDGLKFEKLSLTAEEAQLIDQLKWTAEVVASTFHVPSWKIGASQPPAVGSVEALNLIYYGDALQALLEAMEACLDEGLALGEDMGVEFDVGGLARMDSKAQMETLTLGIGGTLLTPNEARAKIDLPPVDGGDAVYAQQQDFSISALAERDRNKPFSNPQGPPQA